MGCQIENRSTALEESIPSPIEAQLVLIELGKQEAILLCDTKGTDNLLEVVLKRTPWIKAVGLSGTDVSDSGLRRLSDFPQLKHLSIDTNSRITASGITFLSKSMSLNEVEYNGTDALIHEQLVRTGLSVTSQ